MPVNIEAGHIYRPGRKAEVRLVYRIRGGPDNGRHQKSFSISRYGVDGAFKVAEHARSYINRMNRLPVDFGNTYSYKNISNTLMSSAARFRASTSSSGNSSSWTSKRMTRGSSNKLLSRKSNTIDSPNSNAVMGERKKCHLLKKQKRTGSSLQTEEGLYGKAVPISPDSSVLSEQDESRDIVDGLFKTEGGINKETPSFLDSNKKLLLDLNAKNHRVAASAGHGHVLPLSEKKVKPARKARVPKNSVKKRNKFNGKTLNEHKQKPPMYWWALTSKSTIGEDNEIIDGFALHPFLLLPLPVLHR